MCSLSVLHAKKGFAGVLSFTKDPSTLALVVYTSRVPAGFPSPADDHIEGKLDLNEHIIRHPAATFFARAAGESMKDAGIFDGDLLVVDRSITAQSDDIVIAVLHGEMTVKRLKKPDGAWVLTAENPTFPNIPINDAGCEVWGVVTHSIRRHCDR
ncbi:MAG: translesion error-prone DNA polymerase V autoproteolytic subunit [Hyphomicrobiales bacterium]